VKNYLVRKGYNALLTRNTDEFIMLNKRTAHANAAGADLFISVHANASLNKNAVGIETFFYPHGDGQMQKNQYAFYMKAYLTKKALCAKMLAENIQHALCDQVFSLHAMSNIIDRKVKKAPLQVLIGTNQPSVLVEVGFLTNSYEGKLLATKKYQENIAQGIVKGILHYLEDVSSL
jgi:N-acetylmuramoyl-L-alanine amidase